MLSVRNDAQHSPNYQTLCITVNIIHFTTTIVFDQQSIQNVMEWLTSTFPVTFMYLQFMYILTASSFIT
jgi:hypothetical protein